MKDNNDEIEKIVPSSPNFQTELAQKIAEIVPEAVSDGKIDIVKLRELVNGDVENSPEKFGLFWPGKARAQAVAQIPTSATLVPAPEESVDWENTKNIYIEGDNLEVLKALQNSYRRKVKMIYIDPPYNTGKEFIYPDNYQEGLQTYLEYTGQKNEAGEVTESKKETGGRKHTNWLNMMYPRLQLAKSLLTDDGVIFISIDDNEQGNLKKLCDEVFGENNLILQFISISNPRGRQTTRLPFALTHEYVLVYAKNILNVSLGYKELSPEQRNEYKLEDNNGKYRILGLRKRGTASNRVDRPNLFYPIYYDQDHDAITTIKNNKYVEIFPKKEDKSDGVWRWQKSKVESDKDHLVAKKVKRDGIEEWDIFVKDYLFNEDEEKGAKFKSVLTEKFYNNENGTESVKQLFDGKKYFDFPKPVNLLKDMVIFGGVKKNDIILDFFSGSATTAHVVMQLNAEDGENRTHIQVQLPEPTDKKSEAYKAGFKTISDIGKERIRRAGKKILEDYAEKLKERNEPLDVGFRVYKLAPSNFVQWNEEKAKENIQQSILDFADNKKSNASPEAILSEIMLQNKITLDAKIEKKQLSNDGWVYVVDDGNLIAYVDDKQITEDQAKEIAEMTPGKLIIVDSAFNGNDALKINVANICKEKFIKEFKTI